MKASKRYDKIKEEKFFRKKHCRMISFPFVSLVILSFDNRSREKKIKSKGTFESCSCQKRMHNRQKKVLGIFLLICYSHRKCDGEKIDILSEIVKSISLCSNGNQTKRQICDPLLSFHCKCLKINVMKVNIFYRRNIKLYFSSEDNFYSLLNP